MKIDFATIMKSLNGDPIKDGEQDVTLSSIACNALLAPYPDEQQLEGKDKFRRYKLAEKIVSANGEGVDLSVEEIADLKKLIGKAYGPLIVGRSYEVLDP